MLNYLLIFIIIILFFKKMIRKQDNKCKTIKEKMNEKFKVIFRLSNSDNSSSQQSKKIFLNKIMNENSDLYTSDYLKTIKNIKKKETITNLKKRKILEEPNNIPEEDL